VTTSDSPRIPRTPRNGCRAWRRRLLDYLDDVLSTEDRLTVELHAQACEPCNKALRFHQWVEQALHLDSGVEPDAGFEDRILRGVEQRLRQRDEPAEVVGAASRPLLRVRTWLMTAAAVLLLTVFGHLPRENPHQITDEFTDEFTDENFADTEQRMRGESRAAADPDDPDDQVDRQRLEQARRTVRDALQVASQAEDFRAVFQEQTASLAGWPVDGLVLAVIGDSELGLAAIRCVCEQNLRSAAPALRRAVHRGPHAGAALIALGTLGDASALTLARRRLDDADLSADAVEALVRHGSPAAARVLADRDDTTMAALARMGTPGVFELLRREARGNTAATDILDSQGLADAEDLMLLVQQFPDADADAEAALAWVARCVQSGGADAADAILAAHEHGLVEPGTADAALLRLLRDESDPRLQCEVAVHLARGRAGERLTRLLGERDVDLLDAIFRDDGAALDVRAAAAVRLASLDALDGQDALKLALDSGDNAPAAAALLLCCAARAGVATDDTRLSDSLRRARVVAARWKDDGRPPWPWERDRLERQIARVLPRL